MNVVHDLMNGLDGFILDGASGFGKKAPTKIENISRKLSTQRRLRGLRERFGQSRSTSLGGDRPVASTAEVGGSEPAWRAISLSV
jgi:hypothetical protein